MHVDRFLTVDLHTPAPPLRKTTSGVRIRTPAPGDALSGDRIAVVLLVIVSARRGTCWTSLELPDLPMVDT